MVQKHKNKDEILNYLRRRCSVREFCKYDIYLLLNLYDIGKEIKDEIINLLIEDGYLDEQRYANSFVKDKIFLQKWGKSKVLNHLKSKNISNDKIKQSLENINEQQYNEMINKELEKKKKTIKDTDSNAIKQKLINFAIVRGYGMANIDW